MPVSKTKGDQLKVRMAAIGLCEEDIKESFVRSSGKGGQKVNKVSTCVVLKHIPTGIVVKCQKERTQSLNRFFARRRLLEKLEAKKLGKKSEAEKRRWKIRKQKQKRSKRAKEKLLEDKRKQSQKKKNRKPADHEDY